MTVRNNPLITALRQRHLNAALHAKLSALLRVLDPNIPDEHFPMGRERPALRLGAELAEALAEKIEG